MHPLYMHAYVIVLHMFSTLNPKGSSLCVTSISLSFFKLDVLVNIVLALEGAEISTAFVSNLDRDNYRLKWEVDMLALTNIDGMLSNNMFSFCRVRLNPCIEDVKCYVPTPYI